MHNNCCRVGFVSIIVLRRRRRLLFLPLVWPRRRRHLPPTPPESEHRPLSSWPPTAGDFYSCRRQYYRYRSSAVPVPPMKALRRHRRSDRLCRIREPRRLCCRFGREVSRLPHRRRSGGARSCGTEKKNARRCRRCCCGRFALVAAVAILRCRRLEGR